jgi:membrane-bound metal-dependent hydrolase YbcI (DUF457 family)
LGSTFIAVGCIGVGRPICYRLTDIWNVIFKSFKIDNQKIATPALVAASFMGTFSHIFLDSIMHRDLHPFYPWINSNGLLHIVSYEHLLLFCLLAGVIGIIIYMVTNNKGRYT